MKLICKYTTTLNDYYDGSDILIEKGRYYDVVRSDYDKEKYYIGKDYEWIIWGTISDYFCTLAEWREIQINEIFDETIS